MKDSFYKLLTKQLGELKEHGLFKEERTLLSPQQPEIRVKSRQVINLCANNYLGLANDPALIKIAQEALVRYGFGLSSVRFICGTQDIHKELEKKLSQFLGMEDTILYSSCFDANAGLFETILSEEDAVISDSLNHASIFDGMRLSKARRFRYANHNMEDLENKLKEAADSRLRLITTEGVFSMDGIIANLEAICNLADKYDALVMVDDSHGVGFLGENGRGTHELCKVMGRVDILTGTLGKALGGASGGYTSGRREVIEWLRQRSHPYLFSNALAPVITATSIEVLNRLESSDTLRKKLAENSRYFRVHMEKLGFRLIPGSHPIIPIMLGDAKLTMEMTRLLFEEGIYVISFTFPVVPKDAARIRAQISAAHEKSHLDQALSAFEKIGKQLEIIS